MAKSFIARPVTLYRQSYLESLQTKIPATRVYVEVDEAEASKVSGKAPIGVRWVDVRKIDRRTT